MVRCVSTPHHITALFRPVPGPGPGYSGSIGAGLAVEPRARFCRGLEELEGEYRLPQFEKAAGLLGARPRGRLVHPLPPGRGYAVSAASAILGALAASVESGVGVLRAYRAAHDVEVSMSTGLGDVASIACGIGLVIRYSPGPPGEALVDCIPTGPGLYIVAGEAGSMDTSRLIGLYSSQRFVDEVSRSLSRIFREPSLDRFFEEAEKVTTLLGLDSKLVGVEAGRIITGVDDVYGYYVKKRVLVVAVGEESVGEIARRMARAGLAVRLLKPSTGPPRVE
ncbi:pantoate kinase [Aeropyrum camini]|uniref:Pantoate kinase n=1 Tax=Aeropyrum camini SY1 = JCM 12091 TaxID=1198449 RepID=U3TE35_9CREN|nr:pantoate kinase [Aeropyrum camini]BAN90681.1 predicted archaeal kinase [Aeropyrum camini SY1 = JCM 12091]